MKCIDDIFTGMLATISSSTVLVRPCQYQSVTMDQWEPGKLSRPSLFLFWYSKFSDGQKKQHKTGK